MLEYRVLIHPNTKDAYKDHTELMTWMGKPWPLYTDMLKPVTSAADAKRGS